MDEKLYRSLIARMAEIQAQVFAFPPKSMEEFHERLGAFNELKKITDAMRESAERDEDVT